MISDLYSRAILPPLLVVDTEKERDPVSERGVHWQSRLLIRREREVMWESEVFTGSPGHWYRERERGHVRERGVHWQSWSLIRRERGPVSERGVHWQSRCEGGWYGEREILWESGVFTGSPGARVVDTERERSCERARCSLAVPVVDTERERDPVSERGVHWQSQCYIPSLIDLQGMI